ncbi:PEGA domain-containing protein [Brucepastera parasyntrophica]|uniref:PEGA domain-containing protein n=1 Tax=Brucepastera parasyntrophica TaxID=2880008 RepID=UPI00210924C7|nr:PEGA domain-containing protein [Brucepastera parasyntrophica]ULQ59463.1 PEGA domain-containing protein [Brucepastera parasyntrophica]
MKKIQSFSIIFFLFLLPFSVCAESFRVRSVTTLVLDTEKSEGKTVNIGYNDAVAVFFPENIIFLKGVEIEVKIPAEILEYRNSIAYGLYHRIKPAPVKNVIDYQADRIELAPLPSRLTLILQVPLIEKHNLKSGPYGTVISYMHNPASGPLLFRLLPVMKGLPDDIENVVFSVKIKPLFINEGGFILTLTYPDEEQYPVSVRLDETLLQEPHSLQLLSPGNHYLSVVSEEYRNEVRQFTVESARTTELEVQLQDTTPHLFLIAPENADIYLDNELLENPREERAIDPGEHVILFRLGDYELVRQITIEKGRDYTVSMTIDIQVSETP